MRKVLMLAVAFGLTPAARADEAAEKVVRKALQAHGGEKTLAAVKAGELTIKATINILGTDVDFEGDSAYAFPDKMATTLSGEVMGQKIAIVQVVNGDKVRMTVNGGVVPVEDAQKAELRHAIVSQQMTLIAPLLDAKRFTLTAEADAKVGEADAAVVLVTAKGMKDVRLFFDKKTGLLARVKRQGLDQSGQEVDTVSDLLDYKKVDGIQTASTIKVTQDGKPFMTMTISDKKFHDKIDPDRKFDADDK